MTTTLRSARLEQVFGCPLDQVTRVQIDRLVAGKVVEAADLDFKRLYEWNSEGKKSLCSDVAAMANSGGGVILIGVDDENGAASGIPEVDLGESEEQRMRQVVADGVAPFLRFEVWPVPGSTPSRGVYLLVVPASTNAPHLTAVNKAWRYSRRIGPDTRHLGEADLAAAYANRTQTARERAERLAAREEAFLDTLNTTRGAFVVVSLVPDLDGYAPVTAESLRQFEDEVLPGDPLVAFGTTWHHATVRSDCLVALSGLKAESTGEDKLGGEAHADGSGVFAVFVGHNSDDASSVAVVDERIVDGVLSGLQFLTRHASDRADTSGSALARATVWPAGEGRSLWLERAGDPFGDDEEDARHITTAPRAHTVLDLEADRRQLVAAAYRLATPLLQAFGQPESLHLTSDGDVVVRHWSQDLRARLTRWAAESQSATAPDAGNGP